MDKLDDISTDRQRTALFDADDAKAAMRLMVALAYTDDVADTKVTERFGIP